MSAADSRASVERLAPRTFNTVVASPGRITAVLNDRAYGRWQASNTWRNELRTTLEARFGQITILAPMKYPPHRQAGTRVLADWVRPDIGRMY